MLEKNEVVRPSTFNQVLPRISLRSRRNNTGRGGRAAEFHIASYSRAPWLKTLQTVQKPCTAHFFRTMPMRRLSHVASRLYGTKREGLQRGGRGNLKTPLVGRNRGTKNAISCEKSSNSTPCKQGSQWPQPVHPM